MSLENHFDATFTARLALREKQVQQAYRPLIGVHKWFARRPGTVFRNLLLAEFNGTEPLDSSYWRAHQFTGIIADPFMGGGTTIYEANRLGFSVVGCDINPMATWIVRQSLAPLDLVAFRKAAEEVIADTERLIRPLYQTRCLECGDTAEVKYFLWVKTQDCPGCSASVDLFPGYLLAEDVRHPRNVVACRGCGFLNEYEEIPTAKTPATCFACQAPVVTEGPAKRNSVSCTKCHVTFRYPPTVSSRAPQHRLWAIEYQCQPCKGAHRGRFFKTPDDEDLARVASAERRWKSKEDVHVPRDPIPMGDETNRLRRWGYRHYREMFNERQLYSLSSLIDGLRAVRDKDLKGALLTVFSDFLRYQNMLCRYDTYALKCQDIFSVHGFPVGLVQCENNVLGIPKVGAGGFRHFIEKFIRAKSYCVAPFETKVSGGRKEIVPIVGERIEAQIVDGPPAPHSRQAFVMTASAASVALPQGCLDGVFTDPPYFDNVQYAELIDFCYVWLRSALDGEECDFLARSTRSSNELTGNTTMGRDLAHFTEGLSKSFRRFAEALKPGAPFVFTYHHNDSLAYVPIVVSVLDAGLSCTATLPAPAEMAASLHIARTGSSIVDSVFVCRSTDRPSPDIRAALTKDIGDLREAGLSPSPGDIRCLLAGHVARVSIGRLRLGWDPCSAIEARMGRAEQMLRQVAQEVPLPTFLPEEDVLARAGTV